MCTLELLITYLATLDKVARHEQVLLVGRDLDVVRADDGLLLLEIVESLHVFQVRDVEGRDVVAEGDGDVGELAIVSDVGVDRVRLLGPVT